jgi:guanosine-3',5'-bis(diphosphate) 3'-pyrophosphohydrolase
MSALVNDPRQILEAVAFAARAHHGQFRKDGRTPYASHVFRVCLVVRSVFGFDDPRMLVAALLHDTIEDTTTDFDDLAERFGPEIAGWVAALTKDKRLADDARESAYIRGLLAAPWQVQALKLADVYDNLTDVVNLPPEKRRRGVERAAAYYDALKVVEAAEVRQPLRLVGELLDRTRKGEPGA